MINTKRPRIGSFGTLTDDRSSTLAKMCNKQKRQCFLTRILATGKKLSLYSQAMNQGCIR